MLRSVLSLSLVTQRPFRVTDFRTDAASPGLMRRHVTAIESAARVGAADVEGVHIGSTDIVFAPTAVRAGEHAIAIGTAQSVVPLVTMLVPALLTVHAPSTLVVEGGTHVPNAAPAELLTTAYAPMLERLGPSVDIAIERVGFAPASGGRVRAHVEPVQELKPLDVLDRGDPVAHRARALIGHLPSSVAERELGGLRERFPLDLASARTEPVDDTPGCGTALVLTLTYENATAVLGCAGRRGYAAEKVGHDVARAARKYVAARVPVERRLATSLLVPLARAGGMLRTMRLSRPAETTVDLVDRFDAGRLVVAEPGDTPSTDAVQVTALTD